MLTHHLATAPATPPVLVRALVDHARTTADIGLARALASHPNLDLGDAAQLLADLNLPVDALLSRPDVTTAAVLTALADTPLTLSTMLQVLVAVPIDQDLPRLLDLAQPAALTHTLATYWVPLAHRRAVAVHLARTGTSGVATVLTGHARAWLACSTTPTSRAEVLADLDTMATANPALAPALDEVRHQPDDPQQMTGTAEWLTHPDTTPDQVLAWLRTQPPNTWGRLLLGVPDITGAISAAVLASGTTDVNLLAVVCGARTPTHQVQQVLLRTGELGDPLPVRHLPALTGADPAAALDLLRHAASAPDAAMVMCRPDLTAFHLDQALNVARARGLRPQVRFTILFGVGAHPAATADHLQRVTDLLSTTRRRHQPAHLADLLRSMTSTGRLTAVTTTPLPDLLPTTPAAHILAHLLGDALADLAPDLDADQATTLARLADTFPGTLAELVTTATTIST